MSSIALIATADSRRLAMLPAFLGHYRALGVERFYVNLHVGHGGASPNRRDAETRFAAATAAYNVAPPRILDEPYNSHLLRHHHEELRLEHGQRHPWIVWADLDEFQEHAASLPSIIAQLETAGQDALGGFFIDRIARNGFPCHDPEMDLWAQYPIGTDLTASLLKGTSRKIVLARSTMSLSLGHHYLSTTDGTPIADGTVPHTVPSTISSGIARLPIVCRTASVQRS